MPKVTRLNDLGSMHQDYPVHPAISASTTVFANGVGIVRVGDVYAVHSNGKNSHSGNLIQGSPNVFIENKAVGRIGDAISCGGVVLTGSPNVNINGG